MNFYYVYVIQNVDNHDEFYVGFTTNLKQRIDDHNNGTTYSTRARTWRIVYCEAY
ncbi:GIY-YIG nuclease family protein, partial [Moraxella catarrhalis]|uniref:GIY-YIG nuclease family protein n=1 Tax=Moraxella catarrhalis TaxID=480 RepID=UPI003F692AB1